MSDKRPRHVAELDEKFGYDATRRATEETVRRQFEAVSLLLPQSGLFELLPTHFLILNESRQIVYSSVAMADLPNMPGDLNCILGARPGELLQCINSTKTDWGCGTSEACSVCGAYKAIVGALVFNRREQEECRIVTKRHDALDLKVWAAPIERDGQRYVIFAIDDISDVKRRRVLERLFFHDVLNTASGLAGFLTLADESGEAEARDYLRTVTGLAHQLIDEIEAQRDLSAAEHGELKVRIAPLHSMEVVRAVCRSYAGQPLAERREIAVAPESEDVAFDSDLTLLRRVVGNMVKNALEATPEGGTVRVRCGVEAGGRVCFSVTNPGAIPAAVRHQVFQRSFSTKGPDRGLGTYSIKLFTTRYLNGEADFSSSEEAGTCFRVCLPSVHPAA